MASGGSPPHPPFGHLLPDGEKGAVLHHNGANSRSASPHRGEGVCMVAIAENPRNNPPDLTLRVPRRTGHLWDARNG